MCRLGYFPRNFIENCPRDSLVRFLELLEDFKGGDGNGFYYLESGKIQKSASIPLEQLYKNPDKEAFLFHTRRRSHGPVIDYQCHPFETKSYIIMHNGIWPRYKLFRKLMGLEEDVSDSYIMTQTIECFGMKNFFKTHSRRTSTLGVVLIYEKKLGEIYCFHMSGDFEAIKTKYGHVFASNFEFSNEKENASVLFNFDNIQVKNHQKIPIGSFKISPEGYNNINLNDLEINRISSFNIIENKIE